jgi:serine protease Do
VPQDAGSDEGVAGYLLEDFMKATILSIAVLPAMLLAQAPPPPPPGPPQAVPEVRNLYPHGGYLGIGISEITSDRAKTLRLKEEAGVEITHVGTDSPADKAGLKVGDVVLQYNGTHVEGLEQFQRLVRETPVGREVKLLLFRNGAETTVMAKIAQRDVPFWTGGNFAMPDVPRIIQGLRSPMLGVDAEPVEGQLADYFGVKEGGVLVRAVMRNSAAEKAGIKAGDVILRVDDVKVATPAEITRHLRSLAGKMVNVALMRDHKESTVMVTVEVPELGFRRGGRVEPVRLIVQQ